MWLHVSAEDMVLPDMFVKVWGTWKEFATVLAYGFALMGGEVVGVGISVGEHLVTLITLGGWLRYLRKPTIACEKRKLNQSERIETMVDSLLDALFSASEVHFLIIVVGKHIHVTVMFSHMLVKVGNGRECSLAVLTFRLALVNRYVLCEGILAWEPLIALLTLKRLESSLDRVRVPGVAWGQSLESGKWSFYRVLKSFERSSETEIKIYIS